MADGNYPDELIALERSAWEQFQAGTPTVQTVLAVREGIDRYLAEWKAAGDEVRRMDVQPRLKRLVRYESTA
ncbi:MULTISPECIES: hypothetical protein [unclassified Streptomyces]|uniref:Uncharacterized protein n=1 Tax=Streptomyces sp. NBC_00119 TaxID=2975659 RepID=A0AAU1UIN1_9ACTN|nr:MULTISPECIES: hypothetical protein [unclassified Streptomyces]MCX4647969.1 hypothetical protein [Streptomyces sp. NBC_01446]MCX5320549.1 hypothetical protein [Streptomyces sp. NBC_00120]